MTMTAQSKVLRLIQLLIAPHRAATAHPYVSCLRKMASMLTFIAGMYLPMQAREAKADLAWEINTNVTVGDYDEDNPGNEMRITYTVKNNSPSGDANNLITFSFTAPYNMEIWYAELPHQDWSYTTNSSGTTVTFNGNGRYIAPNSSSTFRIYSYHTNTTEGAANATALGDPLPEQFPQIQALVPHPKFYTFTVLSDHGTPDPGTLTNLLSGTVVTQTIERVVYDATPGVRYRVTGADVE